MKRGKCIHTSTHTEDRERQRERERERPLDQGGKGAQDHQEMESTEHKHLRVSQRCKEIPRTEEEFHGIYQIAH